MVRTMTAIALALAASLAWGCSDFLGGLQTRRERLLGVLLISQAAGLAIVLPVALISGEALPSGSGALWAMTAGLAELIAFAAFYRALAIGTMHLIAPIAGTGALVPLSVDLFAGHRPGAFRPPTRPPRTPRPVAGDQVDGERHERAGAGDRGDQVHRPDRQRPVERGERDQLGQPAVIAHSAPETSAAPRRDQRDREHDRQARGLRDQQHPEQTLARVRPAEEIPSIPTRDWPRGRGRSRSLS